MSKQITSEEFIKDGDLRQRCKRIVESEDFHSLLRAAYSRIGPYKLNFNFSLEQHIQDRIDGGRAAIFTFVKELMSLPYKEIPYKTEDENQFVDPMDVLDSNLV